MSNKLKVIMKKSQKKVEIIRIEYWDCGIASHRHKFKLHANKCICAHHVREKALLDKKARAARNILIIRDYDSGCKKSAIARIYGLTPTTVSNIIAKELRIRQRAEFELERIRKEIK